MNRQFRLAGGVWEGGGGSRFVEKSVVKCH